MDEHITDSRRRLKGILCALFGGISWGFSGACGQYIFSNYQVDSAWLATVRMLIAGVVLSTIYIIKNKKQSFDIFKEKRNITELILFAITGIGLCQFAYLLAIKYTNAGTATVLQYVAPVIVMIFVCVTGKTLPKKKEVLAIILALTGILLIATHGDMGNLVISGKGLFWGIMAALGLFFYTVLPGRMTGQWGSLPVIGYSMLLCGVGFALATRFWTVSVELDIKGILAVGVLSIVGTMIAFMLYLQGVSCIGPVKASMISSVEPVSAAIFSVFWLGSKFMWIDIVGFACILFTVFLLAKKEK